MSRIPVGESLRLQNRCIVLRIIDAHRRVAIAWCKDKYSIPTFATLYCPCDNLRVLVYRYLSAAVPERGRRCFENPDHLQAVRAA